MRTAIGYTRLSQDSDVSIPRQKKHIREYADEHGFELERIYDDGEYSSGFDVDRDEYLRVCERVRNEDVDAVIVNEKKRLVRDVDGSTRLFLDLRTSTVEAHSYEEGHIDVDDPVDFAVEVFQSATDHKSKMAEIERSREAIQERIENGCYQGTPPQGLEFASDGCHLTKSVEWSDLERAFELFENTDNPLSEISEETGFGISTLSRMRSRGRSYYDGLLDEYGVS